MGFSLGRYHIAIILYESGFRTLSRLHTTKSTHGVAVTVIWQTAVQNVSTPRPRKRGPDLSFLG